MCEWYVSAWELVWKEDTRCRSVVWNANGHFLYKIGTSTRRNIIRWTDVVLQSWLQQVFSFGNHFYAVKVSMELGRDLSTAGTKLAKIILHRIISVVWLTNFLSEIRSLINPRWWGEHLFLSVKRCQGPISHWNWTHWWSLASCLVREADGGAAVWVVQGNLTRGVQSLTR